MVIRNLGANEFFEFLTNNGFERLNEYLDQHENKVIFKKGGESYIIPLKKVYFPTTIVVICNQANIKPPEGFQRVYDQTMAMLSNGTNGQKNNPPIS